GERQMMRVCAALAGDPSLMGLITLGAPVMRPGGEHLVTGRVEIPRLAPLMPACGFGREQSNDLLKTVHAAGLSRAAATPDHLASAGRIVAQIAAQRNGGGRHGV
ncbi:MAG: hypothetical protein Q8K46_00840, partial [Deltaproteobacteria bacterium]|nr:hypothetical protein [Deltaproteobacteria bacterium]